MLYLTVIVDYDTAALLRILVVVIQLFVLHVSCIVCSLNDVDSHIQSINQLLNEILCCYLSAGRDAYPSNRGLLISYSYSIAHTFVVSGVVRHINIYIIIIAKLTHNKHTTHHTHININKDEVQL